MIMILVGIATSIISFGICLLLQAEPVGAFFMCMWGGILAAIAYGAWKERARR